MDAWTGSTAWSGAANGVGIAHGAYTFNPGDRRTLKLRWDLTPNAGTTSVEFVVDGVLSRVAWYVFPSLRPGVFVYKSAVRVHSIKAWDAPQVAMTPFGSRGVPTRLGIKSNAPPQYRVKGGPISTYRGATLGVWKLESGGPGVISGTLKELAAPTNLPVVRRLVLLDQKTRLFIAETWSDPAGNYTFPRLRTDRKYTVVAYDHTNEYGAVVRDNIDVSLDGPRRAFDSGFANGFA